MATYAELAQMHVQAISFDEFRKALDMVLDTAMPNDDEEQWYEWRVRAARKVDDLPPTVRGWLYQLCDLDLV